MKLTFPEALPVKLVIYKVGLGGVYTILPTDLWTQTAPETLEITLTDGGQFDLDNMQNRVIVDPVAPGGRAGSSNSDFFGCTLNASAGSDPTFPVLMLLSVTYLYRRRARKVASKRD